MSAGSTTRGTLSLTAPFERTPSDLCQTPPGRQSPGADEFAGIASPTQAQAILRAMERMREKIELGWAQDFTARLSGLDGLELLVQIAHDLRTPLTSILFLA